MKPQWYFLIFLIFFLEFFVTGRVGAERNDNFYFLHFTSIFQPILALNDAIMVYFNFSNFFVIFLEFSLTGWGGTERNGTKIFILSHSHPFPSYFR